MAHHRGDRPWTSDADGLRQFPHPRNLPPPAVVVMGRLELIGPGRSKIRFHAPDGTVWTVWDTFHVWVEGRKMPLWKARVPPYARAQYRRFVPPDPTAWHRGYHFEDGESRALTRRTISRQFAQTSLLDHPGMPERSIWRPGL